METRRCDGEIPLARLLSRLSVDHNHGTGTISTSGPFQDETMRLFERVTYSIFAHIVHLYLSFSNTPAHTSALSVRHACFRRGTVLLSSLEHGRTGGVTYRSTRFCSARDSTQKSSRDLLMPRSALNVLQYISLFGIHSCDMSEMRTVLASN
jgi:hypothetical protein